MQAYPGVLQLSKESLQGPSEPRGHQLHDMVPGRADEAAGLATNRRLSSGLPQTIRQSSAVSVHGSMAVNSPDSPVLLWFPSGWTLPIRCRLRACMASPPPPEAVGFTEQGGLPAGLCLLPVGCPLVPLADCQRFCWSNHDRLRPLPGRFAGRQCPQLEWACQVHRDLGRIVGGSSILPTLGR